MNKAPLGLFVILFGRLWENVRSRSIKAESFQRAKCSDPICLCQIDPAVLVDNHPVITPRVISCNHSIKQTIESHASVPLARVNEKENGRSTSTYTPAVTFATVRTCSYAIETPHRIRGKITAIGT